MTTSEHLSIAIERDSTLETLPTFTVVPTCKVAYSGSQCSTFGLHFVCVLFTFISELPGNGF